MGKKRKRPLKNKTHGESKQHPYRVDGSITPSEPEVSHPVLSLYYYQVVTLRQYILQRIPRSSKSRRRRIAAVRSDNAVDGSTDRGHGQDLAGLLDTTLVGIRDELSPTHCQERRRDFIAHTQAQVVSQLNTDTGPQSLQSEIVDFVISSFFTRSGASYQRPDHLLGHGFRHTTQARSSFALPCSIYRVEALYPNKNVEMLKQAPWTEVLPLLGSNGDEIMLGLLLDCGLFMPLAANKGVYCQISGLPLSSLEPLRTSNPDVALVTKKNHDIRTRVKTGSHIKSLRGGGVRQQGLTAILFHRQRIIYARPHLNAKGGIEFGLPKNVLERFPSSQSLQQTAHVMKYIFPRQFGLSNVFTVQSNNRNNVSYKDFSREDEIDRQIRLSRRAPALDRAGAERPESVKLPKRLRGRALELVRQLQNRHRRCCYKELLHYYCPDECLGPWTLAPLSAGSDASVVGTASSDSSHLVTQLPNASQGQSISQQGNALSTMEGRTSATALRASKPKLKVDLTDYATPVAQVSAFCRTVIRKLIPLEFFGAEKQGTVHRKIILHLIDKYIRMRRYENISLAEICCGIKVTQIPWLEPQGSRQTSSQGKVSMSDLQKRRELFHEFLYYLFDSVLIPLIRANFYVTESQVNRNRLFYFRHDVWRRIISQPLANLKASMFTELTPEGADNLLLLDKRRLLGYGSLRLIPKLTGIRPITNLKKKTSLQCVRNGKKMRKNWPSVNSAVAPVQGMLNYETRRRTDLLGSSMRSLTDMHGRLKSFKRSSIEKGFSEQTPLYFVKLDIQSCFDTVPQEGLVHLIEKIISEEKYHDMRYAEMRPGNEFGGMWSREIDRSKAIRKFAHRATSIQDPESILDAVTKGSVKERRNTVFIDTTRQKRYTSRALLDLLRQHVGENLVKIGKSYFKQRNGIPQGSVLSSLLCNLFYTEMERNVLGFLHGSNSLLLRYIDDFLLITSDCDLAMKFLRVMIRGQPAYGISVNPAKSLVNFAACVDGIQIPRLLDTALFPYCGRLIDTRTLEIFKDQDRILDGADSVAAALTDSLTVEITRVPGRAFHRKVLDSVKRDMQPMYLDTAHNSHVTVLSNLYTILVTAAMKMYRYMRQLPGRAHPRAEVVVRTISDVIRLGHQLVRGRHGLCRITFLQLQYLAAAAFRFVLGRKQTRYGRVLRWLDCMLREVWRSGAGNQATTLARVVQTGNLIYGGWRF